MSDRGVRDRPLWSEQFLGMLETRVAVVRPDTAGV